MKLAKVRVVEPAEGGKPRDFDVEVSSDGGETWATLPTMQGGEIVEGAIEDPLAPMSRPATVAKVYVAAIR